MKNMFTVLLVVVLSIFATNSFAGNVYFSGSGGLTILKNAKIKDGTSNNSSINFDNGWNVGGAIGYDFGKFRTEFEIFHRNNNPESAEILGIELDVSGTVKSTSYLFNAIIDIENKSSFTPFLGAGLGIANLNLNNIELLGVEIVDDSTTVFAYKFITGIDYAISPAFSVTADYSFFGTSDPKFEDVLGVDFKTEYHTHNINAGIKYNF